MITADIEYDRNARVLRECPLAGSLVRMDRPAFDFDGAYGGEYEDLARTVIPGYLSSFLQALALLQSRLASDSRVLVVGAGTGIEIVTFKTAEPEWQCTGIDPSPKMINIARRRVAEAGLEDGVELVEGHVEQLAGRTFSAASCFNVMHFLPDNGAKQRLLDGIARRLEPGAPLVLFDLHGDRSTPECAEQYAAWRAYWKIQGMDREARDAFHAQVEAGIHWIPESRVFGLLAETGFEEVQRFFRGLLYGGWIARRSE